MQKDNSEPMTYCQSCGRNILTSNFLIHQGRCQKMSELRSSRVSQNSNIQKPSFEQKHQEIKLQQPIRQPYSFSKMNIKENVGPFKSATSRLENQQKIPCPFCGYGQTLAELDTHPDRCQHREIECNFCRAKYPRSLMDDHMQICSKNPVNIERNQRSRNRMRRHEEQFNQEDQNSMPMIYNQRDRNMYNPSPLMNILDNSLFGSPFGNPQQQQNRGGPTYQVIRFSSNGGPNFIVRSNSSNPFTFIQLIDMLARRANPNQNPGLNQQQLNSLNKIKYHKKNEEPDLCTICYVEFEPNQEMIELSCKHMFHQECIFEWLKRVSTCPVCKKKLKENRHENQEFEQDFGQSPQSHPSNQNYPPNQDSARNNQGGGFFNFFGL